MPQPVLSHDGTRDRLLLAAGHEFARVGFNDASVRHICQSAEANVSAVKYYFGSKEDLYLAVWQAAAAQMVASEPMPVAGDHEDPKETLRAFMAWFMRLVLIEHPTHPWAGQLLAHETVHPTRRAMDVFVRHCAGPIRNEMTRIVRAIVAGPIAKKKLDDIVFAVIALCVNPKHSAEILTRLGHPPPKTKAGVNRLARIMADFAISGLGGLRSDVSRTERIS